MFRLPTCHMLVTSLFVTRLPVARSATYAGAVDPESFDERSGGIGEVEEAPGRPVESRRSSGPVAWLKDSNHSPGVIAFLRRARRALPGDPEFGDPLSVDGDGGPRAAARAADRLLEREAASREVSLGALQVWQALTERVSGKPANREVTLVFTDLVGFSSWSLSVGDEATLKLLRRVSQVVEPPLLEARGQIVKRMGDGIMAVFAEPVTAVRAAIAAREAVKALEVDGYTPRMRVGVHTGRPQRIGSDWLGVDVNIAARVMERATRGELVVSAATLEQIPHDDFESLGVTAKRLRKQVFTAKQGGVPADLTMYRLKTRRQLAGGDEDDGGAAGA
jgi:class 3 adenylate cyclase